MTTITSLKWIRNRKGYHSGDYHILWNGDAPRVTLGKNWQIYVNDQPFGVYQNIRRAKEWCNNHSMSAANDNH